MPGAGAVVELGQPQLRIEAGREHIDFLAGEAERGGIVARRRAGETQRLREGAAAGLVAREEKEAVAADGPADGADPDVARGLVAGQGAVGQGVPALAGGDVLGLAVKLVRPRLDDVVDHPAAGAAVFGVGAEAGHLGLLQDGGREDDHTVGLLLGGAILKAIHLVVEAAGQPAEVQPRGLVFARPVAVDEGLEEREVQLAAGEVGQVFDVHLVDGPAGGHPRRLNDSGVGGDRHRLLGGGHVEPHVQCEDLPGREVDPGLLVGSEARSLDRDFVGADLEQGGAVEAALVGGEVARLVGAQVADLDSRGGDAAAASIGHGAFDLSGVGLCLRQRRRRCGQGKDDHGHALRCHLSSSRCK